MPGSNPITRSIFSTSAILIKFSVKSSTFSIWSICDFILGSFICSSRCFLCGIGIIKHWVFCIAVNAAANASTKSGLSMVDVTNSYNNCLATSGLSGLYTAWIFWVIPAPNISSIFPPFDNIWNKYSVICEIVWRFCISVNALTNRGLSMAGVTNSYKNCLAT